MISNHIQESKDSGSYMENRKRQTVAWLEDNFNELIASEIEANDSMKETAAELEEKVLNNEIPVRMAATH